MDNLEKKGAELLDATVRLIKSIKGLIDETKAPATAAPAAEQPKALAPAADDKALAPAADDKALAGQVKTKAGRLIKKRGPAALKTLLDAFGVDRISKLKPGAGVYVDFIGRVDEALADDKPQAEPVPQADPVPQAEAVPEISFQDLKDLLIKVNGSKKLGRDVTAKILADLGAARLGELKPEQYAEAAEAANKALNAKGL